MGYFCYAVDSFQKAIAQAEGTSPDCIATAGRKLHDAFHLPFVAELVFGVPLAALVPVLLRNWAIGAFVSD